MPDSLSPTQRRQAHRLLLLGVVLFLAGLLIGFAVPSLANPRMGLASHLEAVTNGLFLMGIGLLWPRLALPPAALITGFWLACYGTVANVAATFLAAAWGAGRMMPIAAQGRVGTAAQEGVIQALLVSLALAMVLVCLIVIAGLWRRGDAD